MALSRSETGARLSIVSAWSAEAFPKHSQGIGDLSSLCLDNFHQLIRRARIHDRLLVWVDRLEVVNGALDLLGLGSKGFCLAGQVLDLRFGLRDRCVIRSPKLSWRPAMAYGESAALRRRQSPQRPEFRVSWAIAKRRLPSNQVPGLARRSSAR